MKKLIFLSLFLASGFASRAQSNTDEIQLIQSAYGMEKKQLIIDNMKLTDAEAAGFWKIYDEYEAARKEYGKKRISILTDYATHYDALTDEKATQLMNESLNNQMTFTKLQSSTYKKLSKVMSSKRAAQFTQLESYLENIIRMQIMDSIPFVNELEDTRKK